MTETVHEDVLAAVLGAHSLRVSIVAAPHAEPERAWRVDELAGIAAMSRTSFAQAFTARLGVSPMQSLTDWRVAEARRLLQDPQLSVAAIAERVGYHSEAAFRRTFKRVAGVAPGAVRRRPAA